MKSLITILFTFILGSGTTNINYIPKNLPTSFLTIDILKHNLEIEQIDYYNIDWSQSKRLGNFISNNKCSNPIFVDKQPFVFQTSNLGRFLNDIKDEKGNNIVKSHKQYWEIFYLDPFTSRLTPSLSGIDSILIDNNHNSFAFILENF